jgi:transposase
MPLEAAAREQLDPTVRSYIDSLEEELHRAHSRNVALERRTEQLTEELQRALYRRFGRSSEVERREDEQHQLFTEAESHSTEPESGDSEEQTVTVEKHTRVKPGRKPIGEHVPRIEIRHDIDEAEKQCGCGAKLIAIGEEVSERLVAIPEQVYAERHIRPRYACHVCEGSGDEEHPAVRIAPAPPALIPGSITTPALVAFIATNKFVDHLPLYRQEQRFSRIGVEISRADMSNWLVAVGRRLAPLAGRFREAIREGPCIRMDETPVQVHGEPGRANTTKSYMWLARGGPPEAPVYLYRYSPTRGPDLPREILSDYHGYVQADGYSVYTRLIDSEPGITQVGCWAHARRRFFEAQKASKKTGAAAEGLKHIDALFRTERLLREKDLSAEEFLAERRREVEPRLEKFKSWLTKKSETVLPSSLLGKAVGYTLSEWDHLLAYLEHSDLTPDNNAAERAIRPFVVGRKNWLFAGSPRGAEASCTLYSLIETAKANGLNPYGYLHYVFSHLPEVEDSGDWDRLLPQNLAAEDINDPAFAGVGRN